MTDERSKPSGDDLGARGDAREVVLRYVRHEDRAAFEARGWVFDATLGRVHGYWSVLMRKGPS